MTLRCSAPGARTCTVELRLKSGPTVVASKKVTVRSGRTNTVALRFNNKGAKLLTSGSLGTATLMATIGDSYGLHVTKLKLRFVKLK